MHKKILMFLLFLLFAAPQTAWFWGALPALGEMIVDTSWVRWYNGPGNGYDHPNAIAVDGSGNVYVTGASIRSGLNDDYATIKYYPNGDTAWVRRYNGPGNSGDYAFAIAVDGSGNVCVTGGSVGSGTGWDYATIKYDPNGSEVWLKRYNGLGNSLDRACDIAVDNSGNVYVTGVSEGSGTGNDYVTIKYDPNGNELWVKRYNGPGNAIDEPWAMAVDGSGNVYVTGKHAAVGSYPDYFDYATIKYYANGNNSWVRRYNGPGNAYDRGAAITVDGSSNVYVTGDGIGSGSAYDYATIKYGAFGSELWVERYNGTANSHDWPAAIALDDSGNVYVTGYSYGIGTDQDYATIKHYPDGDTAWVRRYNGPENEYEGANAIAVDDSGNVYVTGLSWGTGTYDDYVTIKYAPNGNELWVKRYNGAGNYFDSPAAIAVDGSGNAYVTGYSMGVWTGYDYATIKYSEALRGDVNKDGVIDMADVVYLINYLFIDGPAPEPLEAGNANCDGVVDIADVVYLINYLFIGGPSPDC